MFIGCCCECKYLDLVMDDGDNRCPRCSGKMISLGITSNEWNSLSDDGKHSLMNSVLSESVPQRETTENVVLENEVPHNTEKTENTKTSINEMIEMMSAEPQIFEETPVSEEPLYSSGSKKGIFRRLIVVTIVICLVAGFFYAVVVINNAIDLSNKYKSAIAMKNIGETDEAYRMFVELGDYKDSVEICKQIEYEKALKFLTAHKYAKAYQLLSRIDNYEEATAKANEILEDRPYLAVLDAEVGAEVSLGKYEQENGLEPITWYVLDKANDNVLLISKNILDAQPFNTENTLDCTLIKWLKTDFYNVALSDFDEKIFDVTLLMRSDIDRCLELLQSGSNPTSYAISKNGFRKTADGNYCFWIGGEVISNNGDAMAGVAHDTEINKSGICKVTDINGVRPALWICPTGEMSFPSEYKYSGENPSKTNSEDSNQISSGSETGTENTKTTRKCPDCNGTGKKLVKWYSEGDWGEVTYTSYECPKCKGTGTIK